MNAFETGSEARAGLGRWIDYYNAERPHSALGGSPCRVAGRVQVGGVGATRAKLIEAAKLSSDGVHLTIRPN